MKDSLNIQHGGNHYKDLEIEPAEYNQRNRIPYCEGSAIKYLTRHQAKGGAEDLKKAMHFCQMALEYEYGIVATVAYGEGQPPAPPGETATGGDQGPPAVPYMGPGRRHLVRKSTTAGGGELAGRWEAVAAYDDLEEEPPGKHIGYRVRWSVPSAKGEYLWVGHYLAGPDTSMEWCQHAANRDAERKNTEKKLPSEYPAWREGHGISSPPTDPEAHGGDVVDP